MAAITEITLEQHTCLSLTAGDYVAILAPALGNNILRMQHTQKQIDFFRYCEETPYTAAKNSPEIYGFPFLYLPNRLEDGILKVSDYTYQLPVNEPEPYFTCLHGFLHTRSYQVVEQRIPDDDTVIVTSQYDYNENDPMFSRFPVAFTIRMTYTLSAQKGLLQEVEMNNNSKDRMLPCGFCSHTCIAAPFVKGTDAADYVMHVPVTKRWELTPRNLPTEQLLALSDYDQQYNTGTMKAVHHVIDNDLFSAADMQLQGQPFHGMVTTHVPSNTQICYEVSKEYQFWCMWNDGGENGYYCPEPLTWMINAPNLKKPANETGYTEIAPDATYHCWQRIYTLS